MVTPWMKLGPQVSTAKTVSKAPVRRTRYSWRAGASQSVLGFVPNSTMVFTRMPSPVVATPPIVTTEPAPPNETKDGVGCTATAAQEAIRHSKWWTPQQHQNIYCHTIHIQRTVDGTRYSANVGGTHRIAESRQGNVGQENVKVESAEVARSGRGPLN